MSDNHFNHVIVGGGVTGLTLANRALELDPAARILILEGAETIGGRVKSILHEDMIVDTGAHWFHGGDDNPFFRWLSRRYDLGPMVEDKVEHTRIIGPGDDPEKTYVDAYELLCQTYDAFKKDNPNNDVSMAEIARLAGPAAALAVARFMSSEWMAGNAEGVSAKGVFEDPLGPGGWQLQNGIGTVPAHMAREVQEKGGCIECAKIVESVFRDGHRTLVRVKGGEIFTADHATITVPVGVLKKGSIATEGSVRTTVMKPLQRIDMGHLFKAFVPLRETFIRRSGLRTDQAVYITDPSDPCFVHAGTASGHSMTVFSGGRRGQELQLASAARIDAFVRHAAVRTGLISDFNEAAAGSIYVSDWSNNPLSLGSYPIGAPGYNLSGPLVCDGIGFAGDAFVPDNAFSPGQMVAAWHSGRMMADRLSLDAA